MEIVELLISEEEVLFVEMRLGMIGGEQVDHLGRGVCGVPEQRGVTHSEGRRSRWSEGGQEGRLSCLLLTGFSLRLQ